MIVGVVQIEAIYLSISCTYQFKGSSYGTPFTPV
jgi:hypothetical protein